MSSNLLLIILYYKKRIHQIYIENVTQYTKGLGQKLLPYYWGPSPEHVYKLYKNYKDMMHNIVI